MDFIEILKLILIVIVFLLSVWVLVLSRRKPKPDNTDEKIKEQLENLKYEIEKSNQSLRIELNNTIQSTMKLMSEMMSDNQKRTGESQTNAINMLSASISEKQEAQQNAVSAMLKQLEERFKTFSVENEQKLEQIRGSVEKRLVYLQEDNNKRLEEMRVVVDEKLQKTLDEKMTRSFNLVSERLEQVYKGLGEMQNLAANVGDLKKVLTNVKSRGIVGEIQLGAILEEILSPEQYEKNVETKKGSGKFVEFAIKLPGDENGKPVYMPIDSKFPGDTYARLRDAYDSGNTEEIAEAAKLLKQTIRNEAKDIHDKYISPPDTTDFAVLFLPFEGLYAEAVNRGLVEQLQREFKVNIAGPSTMAALLNSLQMGFKTLAIQKRSSEVWTTLRAVKTEFDTFEKVLTTAQERINKANEELDKLVGVRTRQIKRKLKNIESLDETTAKKLLDDGEE